MAAAQRKLNRYSASVQSRNAAIASIQINWKKMRPDIYLVDESRNERLEWIGAFLGIPDLRSITDLTDAQLGAVAGEMKRRLGTGTENVGVKMNLHWTNVDDPGWSVGDFQSGNVVSFPQNADNDRDDGPGEVSFAASHEQVYTLGKLEEYLKWPADDMAAYLKKRFKCSSFAMLRYEQAHACVHQLLRIAAHRDLKLRSKGKPVSRKAIAKYIPLLKAELNIDQGKN